MKKLNKRVICADGFSMSVQGNEGAYCSPRVDDCERYTEVEVGYPSAKESLILSYAEFPDGDPTDVVYPYVPAWLVSLVLAKHGGIVSGDVPAGVPDLRAQQ